ncbi:proteasome subunit beta [Natronoarchaeum sp. GCM10025703]|uniref:proteasome subunit beta n=1 Tax=unclassified Natronoarchaeum TaxID=2620183 RepID=UPI0036148244
MAESRDENDGSAIDEMDRPRTIHRGSFDPVRIADGGTASGGTLLGITTGDGVLMAADTRTSRGTVTSSEDVQKMSQVHPTAVLGSTGDLGELQSFVRTIRAEADRYETEHDEPMDSATLSTVTARELREHAVSDITVLLGGVDDGSHVFTIGRDEGVVEETYAAVGSGREAAYGILDAEVPQSPSLSEARLIAGRAIESAIERDVQTGVGVHVAEISQRGVDIDRYDSVDEFR